MSEAQRNVVYSKIDDLPPLPSTVTRVLSITADPESIADDLMHAITPDQTMCATLLKVANSAAFGIPGEVSTLERAVMVLGFEEVKNIVIGKAIFSSFPPLDKTTIQGVGVFWEHAFTCGITAKIIGEHYGLSPGELFICGLIHDVGKLVLLMAYPNDYPLLQEHSPTNHFQSMGSEATQYGISHDRFGLKLAEHWNLPPQLKSAIGYHHNPTLSEEFCKHPIIVQTADILSLIYCCSEIEEPADVERVFYDFLPQTPQLWEDNDLPLEPGTLGRWFEELQETRESNQQILSILNA